MMKAIERRRLQVACERETAIREDRHAGILPTANPCVSMAGKAEEKV